jgi:hypothetical protein
MSITFKPFESKSGFLSPGFSVDPLGNVIVKSITVNTDDVGEESIITVDNIIIRGTQLVQGGEDSSFIAFGDGITGSNLQRLGILENLNVNGDIRLVNGSSIINVLDGIVEVISENTGKIDNVEIGMITPASANFLSVNIGPGDSTGELTVQGNSTFDNVSTDNVTIENQPTAINQATRKDYVDSRITAFAIAFGA